jgi:coenzyme F420-dependent glucose-6-phosphate dehydrogenase
MIEMGYTLSSEEFAPNDLVKLAVQAEEAGFTFALISDHFHPWIDRQGHSPFVWGVIGGVAQATNELRLGTGVTCPIMRIHPAIIAQAAATAGCMMPGRFFLGVGSGEALNEHILGEYWPAADERLSMLQEAIEVIRLLWKGDVQSHRGTYFTVVNARIYDLPEKPVPILMAAAAERAATLAGKVADGYIGTSPDAEVVQTFEDNGGSGKPRYGQLTVCWAENREQARKTAAEWWPNKAIQGELGQELPLPRHFEQAAGMVEEEELDEAMPIGPDPEEYIEAVLAYAAAGYDHVYFHQVGPEQEGFIRFCEREVLPKIG